MVIFCGEATLKIIANGFLFNRGAYLRSFFNILDFVVVVSGYVASRLVLHKLLCLRSLSTISLSLSGRSPEYQNHHRIERSSFPAPPRMRIVQCSAHIPNARAKISICVKLVRLYCTSAFHTSRHRATNYEPATRMTARPLWPLRRTVMDALPGPGSRKMIAQCAVLATLFHLLAQQNV